MNLHISGKNIELTPAMRKYAEEKIGSVEKFQEDIIELRVTIEQKHEHHDSAYHVIAQCHISHDELYCEATHADAYVAIDQVKDEIIRQVRDRKAKYETKNRKAQNTQRELKSIV